LRKKVLGMLVARGVLIEPEALRTALAHPQPSEMLESFLASRAQKQLMISAVDLRCYIEASASCFGAGQAHADGHPEAAKQHAARAPRQATLNLGGDAVAQGSGQPPAKREEARPRPAGKGAVRQRVIEPAGAELLQQHPKEPAGRADKEDGGRQPSAEPLIKDAEAGKPLKTETQTIPVVEASARRSDMEIRPLAKGYDADIAVIQEITDESRCTGQASDFKHYFEDRLRTLRRLLKQRPEMGGAVEVQKALRVERDVKMICMVSEASRPQDKRVKGLWVTAEDETGAIKLWLPDDGGFHDAHVLKDEVVGIVGRVVRPKGQWHGKERGPYVVVDRLVRPELAGPRTRRTSRNPVSVAFVSDVHVGSSHFLPEAWEKMIKWLRSGDGEAARIKYVVMPGDLVDGIGVYPDQEEELLISDVYEQYEAFARLLEGVPEQMAVVLMPGNHDAQRLSEPQPALPEKVRKILGSRPLYVGNPCYLAIEGVRVLAYHGRGFDDFAGNLGSIGYQQPLEIMLEMLKRRHLSPIYGGKNQLAPERRDYLVINPVPDIFVTGHVHGAGIADHKGVVMTNASAWQSQTPFQRMHNFHPAPGRVPWVRLDTLEFGMENFA
jgi:DNA polymerase II small subunit